MTGTLRTILYATLMACAMSPALYFAYVLWRCAACG